MYPFPSPTSWLWGNSPKATKLCAGLAGRLENVFRPPPFQHALPSAPARTDLLRHILAPSHLILGVLDCGHDLPSLLGQKVPRHKCCWEGSWTPNSKLPPNPDVGSPPPPPATRLLVGWPKSSFGFKVQIKTHFSFSSRTLLNNVLTAVLPYYVLLFSRQLHNLIFPKLFIFLSKQLFQVCLWFSRELKFFPLGEFCKDKNKWKSKGLEKYLDESELPGPAVTVFAWSSEKLVLCNPGGRWCVFCWPIPDAFPWVLLSAGLTGSSTCWN